WRLVSPRIPRLVGAPCDARGILPLGLGGQLASDEFAVGLCKGPPEARGRVRFALSRRAAVRAPLTRQLVARDLHTQRALMMHDSVGDTCEPSLSGLAKPCNRELLAVHPKSIEHDDVLGCRDQVRRTVETLPTPHHERATRNAGR